MDILSVIWAYVIPFLIVLTILVFVHELGHYLIARRCGVRVEVFSIGFGPEIFGRTDKAGTRWKFSAIPLGGYVKMFGDADATSMPSAELARMTPEEQDQAFHRKTLGQRSWIVAGGPLANFIFAFFALAVLYGFYGERVPTVGDPTSIEWIAPNSPAESAGLQTGDRILEIGERQIASFEDIVEVVQGAVNQPLDFLIERGEEQLTLVVTPEEGSERDVGRIGISNVRVEYNPVGPLEAVWKAGAETVRVTGMILVVVGEFITGSRRSDELAGPLGIAQVSGDVAKRGLDQVILWTAYLSINLGLLNLFPIPMLDGGHLLFYAIERVRGRPLGQRAQEYGFRIGLALVLALMLFATWNDILRLT